MIRLTDAAGNALVGARLRFHRAGEPEADLAVYSDPDYSIPYGRDLVTGSGGYVMASSGAVANRISAVYVREPFGVVAYDQDGVRIWEIDNIDPDAEIPEWTQGLGSDGYWRRSRPMALGPDGRVYWLRELGNARVDPSLPGQDEWLDIGALLEGVHAEAGDGAVSAVWTARVRRGGEEVPILAAGISDDGRVGNFEVRDRSGTPAGAGVVAVKDDSPGGAASTSHAYMAVMARRDGAEPLGGGGGVHLYANRDIGWPGEVIWMTGRSDGRRHGALRIDRNAAAFAPGHVLVGRADFGMTDWQMVVKANDEGAAYDPNYPPARGGLLIVEAGDEFPFAIRSGDFASGQMGPDNRAFVLAVKGGRILANLPTSATGLPGGALYSDGGTVKIAPSDDETNRSVPGYPERRVEFFSPDKPDGQGLPESAGGSLSPPAPTGVAWDPKPTQTGQVYGLRWDAAPAQPAAGAIEYEVQEAVDGGAWTTVQRSGALFVRGVSSGRRLRVRVRAVSGTGGRSAWAFPPTDALLVPSGIATLAQPANVRVAPVGAEGIHQEYRASWDAVAGASSYGVQVSADGGGTWSAEIAETGTSHVFVPMAVGSYVVRVRALVPSGLPAYVDPLNLDRLARPRIELRSPAGLADDATIGTAQNVTATWGSVSGAEAYKVTLWNKNVAVSGVARHASNTFSITDDFQAAGHYTIEASPIDDDVILARDNPGSLTLNVATPPLLAPPQNIRIDNRSAPGKAYYGGHRLGMTWDRVAGAETYFATLNLGWPKAGSGTLTPQVETIVGTGATLSLPQDKLMTVGLDQYYNGCEVRVRAKDGAEAAESVSVAGPVVNDLTAVPVPPDTITASRSISPGRTINGGAFWGDRLAGIEEGDTVRFAPLASGTLGWPWGVMPSRAGLADAGGPADNAEWGIFYTLDVSPTLANRNLVEWRDKPGDATRGINHNVSMFARIGPGGGNEDEDDGRNFEMQIDQGGGWGQTIPMGETDDAGNQGGAEGTRESATIDGVLKTVGGRPYSPKVTLTAAGQARVRWRMFYIVGNTDETRRALYSEWRQGEPFIVQGEVAAVSLAAPANVTWGAGGAPERSGDGYSVTWNAVTGATRYRFRVSVDGGSTFGAWTAAAGTASGALSADGAGTYSVEVQAGTATAWGETGRTPSVTVASSAVIPAAPTGLDTQPAGVRSLVEGRQVTFTWQRATGAVRYELLVNGSVRVQTAGSSAQTSFADNGTYRVSVRGVNDDGIAGAGSAELSVDVLQLPYSGTGTFSASSESVEVTERDALPGEGGDTHFITVRTRVHSFDMDPSTYSGSDISVTLVHVRTTDTGPSISPSDSWHLMLPDEFAYGRVQIALPGGSEAEGYGLRRGGASISVEPTAAMTAQSWAGRTLALIFTPQDDPEDGGAA